MPVGHAQLQKNGLLVPSPATFREGVPYIEALVAQGWKRQNALRSGDISK